MKKQVAKLARAAKACQVTWHRESPHRNFPQLHHDRFCSKMSRKDHVFLTSVIQVVGPQD